MSVDRAAHAGGARIVGGAVAAGALVHDVGARAVGFAVARVGAAVAAADLSEERRADLGTRAARAGPLVGSALVGIEIVVAELEPRIAAQTCDRSTPASCTARRERRRARLERLEDVAAVGARALAALDGEAARSVPRIAVSTIAGAAPRSGHRAAVGRALELNAGFAIGNAEAAARVAAIGARPADRAAAARRPGPTRVACRVDPTPVAFLADIARAARIGDA